MKSISLWQAQARQWTRIGSPLRPCADDLACYRAALAGLTGRGLILGATPEMADLADDLAAVDNNPGMIAKARAAYAGMRRIVQADWRALPFPVGHFAFAAGDGNFNAIVLADYPRVFAELRRVLVAPARLVVRLYETPQHGETLDAVAAAASRGAIGSFHAFKWRLAMAIAAGQETPDLPVTTIHKVFQAGWPDRDALAHAAGWMRQDIDTIDVYDGMATVYNFPTPAQFEFQAEQAGWRVAARAHGDYELAERCPVLTLERVA